VRGSLAFAGRLAGAAGGIAIDRLAECVGRALPRTPERLARAEVLNALIREDSPEGTPSLPPIRSTGLPGVDFESSNCRNFLVGLDFEAEAAGGADLPKTLYAKIPCVELGTRIFANAVGFWESEITFCQRIAHRVPIRVPRVHAAVRRGSRFVLLLENLNELPGARLFINRDMAAGTTPERARMCLRSFAELHAAFWDLEPDEREALLPARLHTYLAPGGRERTRAMNAAAVAPAHRAAPEIFTQRHVAIFRAALAKWDALVDAWYAGPLTLIHGDSHLANCFEYATPNGPRMGMLDFQGIQWCHGIRDVQYFLINSLEPELLAEHEAELVDHYVDALAAHGIALDAEQARDRYRALCFQTLMVAVVSIGLGSLTERDETVRTILRRSVAAIDRLRFGDWIEAL